jgi:hypothetical protein
MKKQFIQSKARSNFHYNKSNLIHILSKNDNGTAVAFCTGKIIGGYVGCNTFDEGYLPKDFVLCPKCKHKSLPLYIRRMARITIPANS